MWRSQSWHVRRRVGFEVVLDFRASYPTLVVVKTFGLFSAIAILAASAFGQVGDSKWDTDSSIAGIPSTWTNGQSVTFNRTITRPILLNASPTAPITFTLSGVSTGTNGTHSQFSIVFGTSHDKVNIRTSSTWTATIQTNASGSRIFSETNFTPGAKWPYLHLISMTMATNTSTGVLLQYSQPR